ENFTFTLGDTINVSHLRRLTGTSTEPLDLSNLGIESVRGLEYVSKASYINLSHNKISDVSPLLTLPSLTSLDLSYNSICFPLYYPSLADPSESDYVAALKAEFVEYTTGSASNLTISISDQSCDASCSGTSSMASGDHAVCHNSFGSTFTEECRIDHYLSSVSGTCIRDYLGVCFTCDKLNRQCVIDDSSSIYDPLQECGECRTWWYGVDCDQPCPFDPFDEDQFGEVESTGMCGVNHSVTASHGVCLEDDHICQCETDYTGSACEYVKFDDENLEAALCRIVRDDPDAVCDGVAPFEMQALNGILDLSNNDLSAGLKGLEFAINISGLDLSYNPLVDETDVLFISTFLVSNKSFDSLDLSGTGVSDILSTSFGDLFSTITSFAISDCSLTDVSQLTSFINLTSLGLSDVTQLDDQESGHSLTEDDIGSWLSSMESLVTLDISNNNITSLRFLLEMSTQLEELNISGNNVSDLSPLYSFSMLQSLSVIDTRVVQGTTSTADIVAKFVSLEESVTLAEVNIETSYETPSACSYLNLVDAISLNMVCLETFPGSDTWYPVCASDSFAEYSDSSTFSCTQTNDVDTATNCIGGCAYGQECRQVVLSTVGSDLVSGECVDVVVDPALHSCVADMFPSSSPHVLTVYDSSSDSTSVLFSVASLKTLETIFSESAGDPSPILSCSAQDVSDLSGIEHLEKVTEMVLDDNIISSLSSNVTLLETLTNLEFLSLQTNSISSFPTFALLSNLRELYLNFNSDLTVSSDYIAGTLFPSNLVRLELRSTNFTQTDFDTHISNNALSSIEHLNLQSTYVTDISTLSSKQKTNIRILNLSYPTAVSSEYDGVSDTVVTMTNLEELDLSGCGITSIPDLSSSSESLVYLGIADNQAIRSVYILFSAQMFSLSSLVADNCSISDISPLYQFPSLMNIQISGNKICSGLDDSDVLASKFTNYSSVDPSFEFVFESQTECECADAFSSINAFAKNKVCVEPYPGAGSWTVVCSSHSFTTYYPSPTPFTCTDTAEGKGAVFIGCAGGCVYGEECRYDSTSTSSACYPVIRDDGLREYVGDNLVDALFMDSTSAPASFSVASLLNVSSDKELIYTHHSDLTDLSGIEHLVNIFSIDLSYSSTLSDVSLLSSMTNLTELNLSSCSLSNPSDLSSLVNLSLLNLRNAQSSSIDDTVDISEFSSLNNLEFLYLDGWSFIDTLPDFSEHEVSTLRTLRIPSTGISSLEPIHSQADTLNFLYMADCDLSDVVDRSTLFDPLTSLQSLEIQNTGMANPEWLSSNLELYSLIASNNGWYSVYSLRNHMSLEILDVSYNFIADPSPLYTLSSSVVNIFMNNNRICGANVSDTLDEIFIRASEHNYTQNYECPSICYDGDETIIADIADNKVCLETFPGSDTWYPVCASDSFAEYSDASTFSCTQTNDVDTATNCIGGCAYGQECRQVVLSTVGSDLVSGQCVDVVVDPALHSCVADMFPSSSPHVLTVYDSSSDSTSVLFSVASLKTLETVSSEPAGDPSPILSCSAQDVSDLSGIEHLEKVTNFDLSGNSLLSDGSSYVSLLSTLTNLEYLDLNSNLSLESIPDLHALTVLQYLD
ncbi:hypothetical protein ADUPG1_013801, partial [Aduncisulcus paluster]